MFEWQQYERKERNMPCHERKEVWLRENFEFLQSDLVSSFSLTTLTKKWHLVLIHGLITQSWVLSVMLFAMRSICTSVRDCPLQLISIPHCGLSLAKMFLWSSKISRLDFRRSLVSTGSFPGRAGSFPEQRLVIEPTKLAVFVSLNHSTA